MLLCLFTPHPLCENYVIGWLPGLPRKIHWYILPTRPLIYTGWKSAKLDLDFRSKSHLSCLHLKMKQIVRNLKHMLRVPIIGLITSKFDVVWSSQLQDLHGGYNIAACKTDHNCWIISYWAVHRPFVLKFDKLVHCGPRGLSWERLAGWAPSGGNASLIAMDGIDYSNL